MSQKQKSPQKPKSQQQPQPVSLDFVNALNKYIPSLVLSNWMQNQSLGEKLVSLPELQRMETVVLFADISGFTMISEACASMGVRGNEELAFCINRYMEGMVKSLGKYGGDIIKFVGDAMIVMWPVQESADGVSENDRRVTTVRKAIQCAWDIQQELNNKKIMSNVTNLSVKIGIGYGTCALLYVGGVFNRSEFFTVGEALSQALKSEENASGGGQIIVSQSAWKLVQSYFTSEQVIDDHSGYPYYRITSLIQGIRTRADAVLLKNLLTDCANQQIQQQLRSCVPAAIMPYLELGYEQYGSETRRLTVMFASLGVDLSSAQTQLGMEKIQRIVTTVQQQVYRLEGSVNKLVMDDKGSTLICIWGLSPFGHEDDSARAILTGLNMRRELLKIDNTWCNIGISTGEVFSGVVGTSGSRKEFSVLGDYVNLAARIMYQPKKYKQTGKIFVDLNTKREAQNFIRFSYHGHCEFKGKSISLPIYEPIDPDQESRDICLKKVAPIDTFLKLNSNPFLIDRDSEIQAKLCKQYGRDTILNNIVNDLLEHFDPEQQENENLTYTLTLSGDSGSGKTLLARCLIEALRKKLPREQQRVEILTSSLNQESSMRFLAAWRPIVQQLAVVHAKKSQRSVAEIVAKVVSSKRPEVKEVLKEIFGQPNTNPPFVKDPIWFVKREKYPDDIANQVQESLQDFIHLCLCGGSQASHEDSGDSEHHLPSLPLILLIDNCHLLDAASWTLLGALSASTQTPLAFILLIQNDTQGQLRLHPEVAGQREKLLGDLMQQGRVVDLGGLRVEEVNGMLSQEVLPRYHQMMNDEITQMTQIVDPQTSIKNPITCIEKAKELRQKYFLAGSQPFNQFSKDVLELALQRCEGNILLTLHFLFNLLSNGFLEQKGACLFPSKGFAQCKAKNDWSTVPVPAPALKQHSTLLDVFIKDMRSKPSKTEQDLAVKGVLILKAAAVVGESFTSRVIEHITPLRNEGPKTYTQILRLLEQYDYIEILDESDPQDIKCRFRKAFFRESIYQFMLYRAQKKGLHQLVVSYITDHPNDLYSDPEYEAEILTHNLCLAEDLTDPGEISAKAKQTLVIKRIQNILNKNPNARILKATLTKQGEKVNHKVEERLVLMDTHLIRWFHDEQELKSGVTALGTIPLSAVYHCVPADTKMNTLDFNIGTCAWKKKDQEKEGRREFIFGARSISERDEWITTIEFMRAKAVYDGFVSKYCNVTFQSKVKAKPIQDNGVHRDRDERHSFVDFGLKLKQKAARSLSKEASVSRFQRRDSITKVDASPQDLAIKLKKIYALSIGSFINMISQNSCKAQRQCDNFKKAVPDCFLGSVQVGRPSIKIISDELAIKRHGTSNTTSSQSEEQQSDERVRRVSILARSLNSEEDSKSQHRNSPIEITDVIEEHEDDSSSSQGSQHPYRQPRRSVLSQNTNSPIDVLQLKMKKPDPIKPSFLQVPQNSLTQSKLIQAQKTAAVLKKSRISMQLELHNNLSKKRELTFNKNGVQEDDPSTQLRRSRDLQIFAINNQEAQSSSPSSASELREEEVKRQITAAVGTKKQRVSKKKKKESPSNDQNHPLIIIEKPEVGVEGPRNEVKEEEKVVKNENVEENDFEASSVSTVGSDQKKDLKELITRTVERQVEKALRKIMDDRSVGNSRLDDSYRHTSREQQDEGRQSIKYESTKPSHQISGRDLTANHQIHPIQVQPQFSYHSQIYSHGQPFHSPASSLLFTSPYLQNPQHPVDYPPLSRLTPPTVRAIVIEDTRCLLRGTPFVTGQAVEVLQVLPDNLHIAQCQIPETHQICMLKIRDLKLVKRQLLSHKDLAVRPEPEQIRERLHQQQGRDNFFMQSQHAKK